MRVKRSQARTRRPLGPNPHTSDFLALTAAGPFSRRRSDDEYYDNLPISGTHYIIHLRHCPCNLSFAAAAQHRLIIRVQSPVAKSATMSSEATTKKFQKGERQIPAASEKAQKYYPAEDESHPKKVRCRLFSQNPSRSERESEQSKEGV